MKEKDFRKDCLLTDSPVLARQTAARGLPVIYYERPGAEPVYEADYTVQSLDDLDELFFQRVYERHYGLPWCIGETERLKIRESTEEDVEKLLELFSDAEAVRWLFDEEKENYSREEQREKLEAYVRNRYAFFGYGFYSVLLKTTGELAAWAGFQEREYHGKTVLEFGYLTAAAFRKQGIATEAAGILVREMEELTGETQAYLFCHPDNQPSRRTAEKLCALYPEHFQTVVDQEKADSWKL